MQWRLWLSLVIGIGTFFLILLGGVVHTTGASLACPDWPLCFNQVFPTMRGGILYEHSHRLLASLIAILTVILTLGIISQRPAPSSRLLRVALIGPLLIFTQALLGGLTVLWRLPPVVSVLHLCTSMAFLAWAVSINWLLRTQGDHHQSVSIINRRGIMLATLLVYGQIALGAWCRHLHASLACGLEVVTCAGAIWPGTWLQWIQSFHRFHSLVVFVVVIAATIKPMKTARRFHCPDLRRLIVLIHMLLTAQMVFGVLTIKTAVHLHVVTMHLALGAALWLLMVRLWLRLGVLNLAPKSQRQQASTFHVAIS